MSKISFSIIILTFVSSQLLAQAVAERIDPLLQNENVLYKSSYDKIKGSPFLSDSWNIGEVILKNGQRERANIKYDIYIDELIVKRGGGSIIINKPLVKGFNYSLDGVIYNFSLVNMGEGKGNKYLHLLENGPVKLYKNYFTTIKKGEVSTGYSSSRSSSDQFINSHKYVYQMADKPLTEVPKAKKIAEILPDFNKEISAFIKKERINTKREKDIIKVTNYMNNLLK